MRSSPRSNLSSTGKSSVLLDTKNEEALVKDTSSGSEKSSPLVVRLDRAEKPSSKAPGTPPTKRSLPKITLETLNSCDINSIESYIALGGDINEIVLSGRPLIVQAFISAVTNDSDKPTSPKLSSKHALMFIDLLGTINLKTNESNKQKLFDYVNNDLHKLALFKKYFDRFVMVAQKKIDSVADRIEHTTMDMDKYLMSCGLNAEKLDAPQIKSKNKFVQSFVALCSGYIGEGTPNHFDRNHIKNSVYGLLGVKKPEEILAYIRLLWRDFNNAQQLIAIFIIRELILSDNQHKRVFHPDFLAVLRKFLDEDILTMEDSQKATVLKGFLESLIKKEKGLYLVVDNENIDDICILNFLIIRDFLNKPECIDKFPSVIKLLEKSLRSSKDRDKVVDILANDLNLMMLVLFKRIHLSEFFQKEWQSEQRNLRAHNLLAMINQANMISSFIQATILLSKPADAPRYISLFILVAYKLCQQRDKFAPDLATANAIIISLGMATITRLKLYFAELPNEIKEKYIYLEKLFDQANNAASLRQWITARPTAILNLGLMLKDIVFIYEGNKNEEIQSSLLAKHFIDFNRRQKTAVLDTSLTTNLATYLQTINLSDDQFYDLSLQHIPTCFVVTNLTLSEIESGLMESLNKGIAPRIQLDGEEYQGVDAIKPLLKELVRHISKDPASIDPTEIQRTRRLIVKFIDIVAAREKTPVHNIRNNCLKVLASLEQSKVATREVIKPTP